jgi:hypothetical protein
MEPSNDIALFTMTLRRQASASLMPLTTRPSARVVRTGSPELVATSARRVPGGRSTGSDAEFAPVGIGQQDGAVPAVL